MTTPDPTHIPVPEVLTAAQAAVFVPSLANGEVEACG